MGRGRLGGGAAPWPGILGKMFRLLSLCYNSYIIYVASLLALRCRARYTVAGFFMKRVAIAHEGGMICLMDSRAK